MRFSISLLLILVAGASATAGAAEPAMSPGLWELSVKMSIPGMPVAMPEHTYKHCYTPDEIAKREKLMTPRAKGENCKLVDMKRVGNTMDYTMACKGNGSDMKVQGHMVFASSTAYHATMHMKGVADGHPMEMTQEVTAKRIGGCPH